MTLKELYFDWMYDLVCKTKNYSRLLSRLNDIEFVYILRMDANRAADGVDLRYRFGHDQGFHDAQIATELDTRPCSVLEMMVALAFRCEEHIMDDPDIGNRTGEWFWIMIRNLGLDTETNRYFNEFRVNEIVQVLLDRDYEPDGTGGLFTVKHCGRDLRTVDIWYQMCWYLDEYMGDRYVAQRYV